MYHVMRNALAQLSMQSISQRNHNMYQVKRYCPVVHAQHQHCHRTDISLLTLTNIVHSIFTGLSSFYHLIFPTNYMKRREAICHAPIVNKSHNTYFLSQKKTQHSILESKKKKDQRNGNRFFPPQERPILSSTRKQ